MRSARRWIAKVWKTRRLAAAAAVSLPPLIAFLMICASLTAKDERSVAPRAGQLQKAPRDGGSSVQWDGTRFTCADNAPAEGLLRLASRAIDVDDTSAANRLLSLAEALGADVEEEDPYSVILCVEPTPEPRGPQVANHPADAKDLVLQIIPPPQAFTR